MGDENEHKTIKKIIVGAIVGIIASFFTAFFTIILGLFNPFLILYSVLATIITLIIFYYIYLILRTLNNWILNFYNDFKYSSRIKKLSNELTKYMIEKEIFMVNASEFVDHILSGIYFEIKSLRFKKYELENIIDDTLNFMKEKEILTSITKLGIIFLTASLKCNECEGHIEIYDKIDEFTIKCVDCQKDYILNDAKNPKFLGYYKSVGMFEEFVTLVRKKELT